MEGERLDMRVCRDGKSSLVFLCFPLLSQAMSVPLLPRDDLANVLLTRLLLLCLALAKLLAAHSLGPSPPLLQPRTPTTTACSGRQPEISLGYARSAHVKFMPFFLPFLPH